VSLPSLSPQLTVERFQGALQAHDLAALAACLHPNYRSFHLNNPQQIVNGRASALAGWQAIFNAVPDLCAELQVCLVDNDTARTEWHWHGRTVDGFPYESNSIMVFTIRSGQIIYAEISAHPTETTGPDWDTVLGNLLNQPRDEHL
jgi:ketosteroid isomerase-like protein